jgi:hypothetical protein
MVRILVVAEEPCGDPPIPMLSFPDVADMVVAMCFRDPAMPPVCTSDATRIPTAAFYNRYKLQLADIDRRNVAT